MAAVRLKGIFKVNGINKSFDVIVIGAGHAGCEAAFAAAKLGCSTLLLTLNYHNIAFMPCNPSIGGPAKGHLVREIDALGGMMGRIIDRTYLQMRLLNTQKGPAVWALRAQADKRLYQQVMIQELEKQPNLTVRQAEVAAITARDGRVTGITTRTGLHFNAAAVVLATGTFLQGRVFIGGLNFASGPMGQLPADLLSESLNELGLELTRYKTGTPARVRRRSIDFSQLAEQPGGFTEHGFSFWEDWRVRPEHLCWLAYTRPQTHQVIRQHLHEAAMYTGDITGVGPRYCPSIESKLVQFPDKERHQVFVEPEGADSDEMYLAGLSTSLPESVQELFLQTIPGFERLEIVRPGYAIEYDAIQSGQFGRSLESKKVAGLFSAGQINGTSGYEEAAAQGLMAGINAALKVKNRPPLVLDRSEAYIGVLIDDLVTKDNREPYRVLTSRAEFRLTLRADSADERLSHYGFEMGLLPAEFEQRYQARYQRIYGLSDLCATTFLNPDEKVRRIFEAAELAVPKNRFNLADLLKRPEITADFVRRLAPDLAGAGPEAEEVAIRFKYQGYLEKEKEQAKKLRGLERRKIPADLDYDRVANLAREAREKFSKFRPETFGQAMRISGVNPADLTALLFYIESLKG